MRYLPKPNNFIFQWHVTERCNLKCRHCYQDGKYLKNELNTEELFHILNQYLNLLNLWGIKGRINVTGGEPFIRDDFFQLLEKFHEHKDLIDFAIMTNGSLITKNIARKLKNLGIAGVQVSLEGLRETNDFIRGNGTFDKTIEAARILVDEGIHTRISFTSSRMNYKDFPKVVELGRDINVDVVWTDRLTPCGYGKQLQEDMLEPLELKKFYESVHKISKELKEKGSKTAVPTNRSLYFLVCDKIHICPAGESIICVMPDGDVLPCRRMPIVVGNLMRQSLFEVWYSSEMLWRLRDRNEINSLCRSCEYFEKCMGGGRCITYGYCGDPFAPDPQCWIAFNKLPSPEELKSYKSVSKEFSPRFSVWCHKDKLNQFKLVENRFVKIGPNDLEEITERILKESPEQIIISFQLSKNNLNYDCGKKIINFLQKIKKGKINFKIAKPLPRCLFGFDYQRIVRKFNIPKSCKDCLELFKTENDKIILCNGKHGPKLKYMNDRDCVHEYFELLRESKPNERCKSCLWFLRNQCSGLCLRVL